MLTNNKLVPAKSSGWSAGFGNMLGKELRRWVSLKAIATQLVIWFAILNSMVILMLFVVPNMPIPEEAKQVMQWPEHISILGINVFFQVCGIALILGSIILSHDTIFKERETGTAAWLLSKPLSRKAFVLAKLLANGFGILGIILLAQGIIAYALCSFADGALVPIVPFFSGVALVGLECMFFMALSVAAGTFTASRSAVLGIPVLVFGMGVILPQIVKEAALVSPTTLDHLAYVVSQGGAIASDMYIPILAVALVTAALIVATIWKFDRLEL